MNPLVRYPVVFCLLKRDEPEWKDHPLFNNRVLSHTPLFSYFLFPDTKCYGKYMGDLENGLVVFALDPYVCATPNVGSAYRSCTTVLDSWRQT
jgi:hypothetical protein